MAKPWKHPQTGTYYLRRQIPAAIRAAFAGRQLHKVSLGTKDAKQATVLFLQANAELDIQFGEARDRLARTGSPLPSSRDRAEELVGGYFAGEAKAPGGLDGAGRLLLARVELDRGLWNETHRGCSYVSSSTTAEWAALAGNAALLRSQPDKLKPIQGRAIGAEWQCGDEAFHPGARDRQLARLVEQVALHHDVPVAELPEELASVLAAYLDALPVGTTQARKPRAASGRLRPDLRLPELFADWQAARQPRPQSALEYRGAMEAFVDFVGDVRVAEITNDDLLDFRDALAKLPASMPRADRQLPFSEQIARHDSAVDGAAPRVGPATIKKRVGGIQALLSFAHEQKWTKSNVGRDVPILDYAKRPRTPRHTFEEEELRQIFSSPLFLSPETWAWRTATTSCTLYWLFLINCTTGARIEEVGQALLADVKTRSSIVYIDIDDHVGESDTDTKSVKTDTSRRVIPMHGQVLALGFAAYCDALRAAGHSRLFPDLTSNSLGKRTHDASRRANRVIDKLVSTDRRLVFHSLRHGFKDLATEAEIQDRVIDQICGHAPTTVGGKYGRGVRLPVLHRLFHKVSWSFLPWAELRAAAATIDWTKVAAEHSRRAAR